MQVLNRSDATAATIILNPLTLDSLHGFSTGYVVEYSESRIHRCTYVNETSKTSSTFQDIDTILLTGLNPMEEYCVRIAASTSEGVGPFTNGTNEIPCENYYYQQKIFNPHTFTSSPFSPQISVYDNTLFQLPFSEVDNCGQWKVSYRHEYNICSSTAEEMYSMQASILIKKPAYYFLSYGSA